MVEPQVKFKFKNVSTIKYEVYCGKKGIIKVVQDCNIFKTKNTIIAKGSTSDNF